MFNSLIFNSKNSEFIKSRNDDADVKILYDYALTYITKGDSDEERMSNIKRMMMNTADTLDSYCTARSLLVLFCIYMNDENWEKYRMQLFYLINNILVPMFDFSVNKRILIGTAITRLNKLIKSMTPKRSRNETNNTNEEYGKPPLKQQRTGDEPDPVAASVPASVSGGSRKKLKFRRSTKRVRRRA